MKYILVNFWAIALVSLLATCAPTAQAVSISCPTATDGDVLTCGAVGTADWQPAAGLACSDITDGTVAGCAVVTAADAAAQRTALDVDQAGTDNSTDRIIWRITNNVSPIASGTTDLACWRTTEAITLSAITASVVDGGSTSGTMTVDVHEAGSTIMSANKLDIQYNAVVDDGTAALSDTSIASGAELCAQVDAVSTGSTELGLTIILEGTY